MRVHARSGVPLAREGLRVVAAALHLLCLRRVDVCRCDGPSHSLEGHDVITAELVACTLGQRRRPELHAVAYAEGGYVTPGVRPLLR